MRNPFVIVACLTSIGAAAIAQPTDQATAVSDLTVRAASLRPESDVPRYSEAQIEAFQNFARENFSKALTNEGRGDRGLISSHGARQQTANPLSKAAGTLETHIQIMGMVGATEGRRRALFRQMDRAAEEAREATAAANSAFIAWLQHGGARQEVETAERAREAAVRNMLEVREKALDGVAAADRMLMASINIVAMEDSDAAGKFKSPGLTDGERETIYRFMEDREYRLAAEQASRDMKVEDVAVVAGSVDGKPAVRVSGLIRNVSIADARVLPFNLVFYDQDGKAFSGMLVQPDERPVPAKETRRFSLVVAMDGDVRISRAALIFGPPSFRPRPVAQALAR